jgi:hypothetical protein
MDIVINRRIKDVSSGDHLSSCFVVLYSPNDISDTTKNAKVQINFII